MQKLLLTFLSGSSSQTCRPLPMALSDNSCRTHFLSFWIFPVAVCNMWSINFQCDSELLLRLTGVCIQCCLQFFHLWTMKSPSLNGWNHFWCMWSVGAWSPYAFYNQSMWFQHIFYKKIYAATLPTNDVSPAQVRHLQHGTNKSTALDGWQIGLSGAVLSHVRFKPVTKIFPFIDNANNDFHRPNNDRTRRSNCFFFVAEAKYVCGSQIMSLEVIIQPENFVMYLLRLNYILFVSFGSWGSFLLLLLFICSIFLIDVIRQTFPLPRTLRSMVFSISIRSFSWFHFAAILSFSWCRLVVATSAGVILLKLQHISISFLRFEAFQCRTGQWGWTCYFYCLQSAFSILL